MSARPNLLGIGTAKAGTTSLANVLGRHPDIFMSSPKELHYFDNDKFLGERNLDWYFGKFESNRYISEFTPSYLYVDSAPTAIRETLGQDVKFIVSLRNPVLRAFSHYSHAVKNWADPKYRALNYPIETLSFEKAIAAESSRLEQASFHPRHLSYFAKGLYAEQLERYFAVFPRANFFIYLFEDFVASPTLVLEKLWKFLDLPNLQIEAIPQLNSQTIEGGLSPQTYESLMERYEPSIQRLSKLLDRNLDVW